MNWEDIKFPPINLWSAPRLSQDSPSPEEHSLMVKRRSLLTVKYEKLESDRNRQCEGSLSVKQRPHKTSKVGSTPILRTNDYRGIAQPGRATGSYPEGRMFESCSRNQVTIEQLESSLPCEGRNADSNSAGHTK